MMTNRAIGAILVVLSVFSTASVAAPVDHDAPSGIASVAPLFGKLSFTFLHGEKLGFPVIAVGTNGSVFCVDYEGKCKPFTFGGGNGTEWPVDFALVVEWTPAAVEVPWYDTPIVTMGTILTSDGERWIHCIKKVSGDWDEQGEIRMAFEWKRLDIRGQ